MEEVRTAKIGELYRRYCRKRSGLARQVRVVQEVEKEKRRTAKIAEYISYRYSQRRSCDDLVGNCKGTVWRRSEVLTYVGRQSAKIIYHGWYLHSQEMVTIRAKVYEYSSQIQRRAISPRTKFDLKVLSITQDLEPRFQNKAQSGH